MITKQFGGTIEFSSKLRSGSTFFFTFDIKGQPTQESVNLNSFKDIVRSRTFIDKSEEPLVRPNLNNHKISNKMETIQKMMVFKHNRILVIDDDEMCLMSLKCLLHNLGFDTRYQVDFSIDGASAL